MTPMSRRTPAGRSALAAAVGRAHRRAAGRRQDRALHPAQRHRLAASTRSRARRSRRWPRRSAIRSWSTTSRAPAASSACRRWPSRRPTASRCRVVSNNVVILPSVYKSVPFDMPGDFTPIAVVGATPIVLVVNPNKVPAKDRKEFARAAQEQARRAQLRLGRQRHDPAPGRARCSSTRPASRRGTSRTRAWARCVTDLIGGQVDFGTAGAAVACSSTSRAARCAPSAWAAPQRTPAAPDIPTFAEQGLPSYVVEAWFARDRAQGHARGRGQARSRRARSAFADPAVKEAMAKQGNTINVGPSEHGASSTSAARRRSTPSW